MQVAVICESMGVKSSLSPPILIKNNVRRVVFMNDFSEEIDIEYQRNEDGDIILTAAYFSKDIEISILDDKDQYITDIKSEEILVTILSEE